MNTAGSIWIFFVYADSFFICFFVIDILSAESKSRKASTLKAVSKFLKKPGR